MKKKIVFLSIIVYCALFMTSLVHADYVMPYPSYMPGNSLYKVSRIVDRLKFYWSWGNIAQIKYHLALADKYLIEAKTLMEYKQYLLGTDALLRSDKEFIQLPAFVAGAKNEKVDVTQFRQLIAAAADKHDEVLTRLLSATPDQFTWTPEKASPTVLLLHKEIKHSQTLRSQVRQQMVP